MGNIIDLSFLALRAFLIRENASVLKRHEITIRYNFSNFDVVFPCRLMFFEQAREQAEKEFQSNNKDAMVSSCHFEA